MPTVFFPEIGATTRMAWALRARAMSFERLPPDTDGLCDYYGRKIKIRKTLRAERQLEVVIHECLHAAHWDLDETAITETAEDLARVLWRLGYKITPKT